MEMWLYGFPTTTASAQSCVRFRGGTKDTEARVWWVPLDPDRAHSLTALFESVPYPVDVSDALGRALARRCAKRSPTELLVDLARPDSNWWFSFATDGARDLVEVLLQHPGAYRVPAIERGLLPIDQQAAQILRECSSTTQGSASPTMPGTP